MANVSIHATLAGGDVKCSSCGSTNEFVSIHATLAGGDADDRAQHTQLSSFYPRHPRGWRPAASL